MEQYNPILIHINNLGCHVINNNNNNNGDGSTSTNINSIGSGEGPRQVYFLENPYQDPPPQLEKLKFDAPHLWSKVIEALEDLKLSLNVKTTPPKPVIIEIPPVSHPLSGYPEKCPPGGADSVVVYTTSLQALPKAFEDCKRVRSLLKEHHVAFHERDVWTYDKYLEEFKKLLPKVGQNPTPRVFVRGRYIGGVDEMFELNRSGQLGMILSFASVKRVMNRRRCEGCDGPCLDCGRGLKKKQYESHKTFFDSSGNEIMSATYFNGYKWDEPYK